MNYIYSFLYIFGFTKPSKAGKKVRSQINAIKKFQELGANIRIYDPYFKTTDVFGIKPEENLDDVFTNVNAAIIVTGHDEFKKYEISKFVATKSCFWACL